MICTRTSSVIEQRERDTAARNGITGSAVTGARGLQTQPPAIPGYEGLQPYLDRFFQDHPDYEHNVFVMMRFREEPHYVSLFEIIRRTLAGYGLKALRVDMRSYPDDDDLWANIVVYMMGCARGIAIFDDFEDRDFNPNVAIEYGFMRALSKRVLILKEQRMPRVPADVTGSRFRPFDMMRLEETVARQVEAWLGDIGIAAASSEQRATSNE
jgi:hypothetical protein